MRFLTAGESHGPGLTVIVDDFPAGVPISENQINQDLARRQQGYGRSVRQKIEQDQAVIHGGIRFGLSTGAPIALWIENKEHAHWQGVLDATGIRTPEADAKAFSRPRPGHADLAGAYKYGHVDLRDVLERASARETAARVAAGAIAKALLAALNIQVVSHVVALGAVHVERAQLPDNPEAIANRAENNDLRCAGNEQTLTAMRKVIDEAQHAGDSLGGEIEVMVIGLPPGLGSYAQWDRRLDGRLAQALMSIQAVKAVGIGEGFGASDLSGQAFQDEIFPENRAGETVITRPTNRAGGLEGGVSNGMPLVLRAVMKPLSTLRVPLKSVDLKTGEPEAGHFERTDVTAVPACAVVAEAMTAIVLAQAVLDKFGRDSLGDIQGAYQAYTERLQPKPASTI